MPRAVRRLHLLAVLKLGAVCDLIGAEPGGLLPAKQGVRTHNAMQVLMDSICLGTLSQLQGAAWRLAHPAMIFKVRAAMAFKVRASA